MAYTSEATNLARGDRSPVADVYKTSFARTYSKRRGKVDATRRALHATSLVSATRDGARRQRAVGAPTINPNGRYVAFATEATDVLPCVALQAGDGLRHERAERRRGRRHVGPAAARALGVGVGGDRPAGQRRLGPPVDDASTGRCSSTPTRSNLQRQPASGGQFSDRNGFRDVFFWSIQTQSQSLQSRDSDDQIPFTASSRQPEPAYSPALGASAPATSAYNNYVVFESANPALDLPWRRAAFPAWSATAPPPTPRRRRPAAAPGLSEVRRPTLRLADRPPPRIR